VSGASGILGPVFCDALAEAGADVVLTDIAAPEAEAGAIATRHGVRTRAYALDLREPDAADEIMDAVEQDFGPIGVFMGNAATKGGSLDAFFTADEDFPVETWREIMVGEPRRPVLRDASGGPADDGAGGAAASS
jgi:NAD(P)-dependent dehydrogenase (short-subunit alcohol dehydrogenase family)